MTAASTPRLGLGRMSAGGVAMSAQVQFSNKLLAPAVLAGIIAAVATYADREQFGYSIISGLVGFAFTAMIVAVLAYPLAWYMKLRALDGLSPARAVLAMLWRAAAATLLLVLLTSLVSAAKFLNSFLPEWAQLTMAVACLSALWYGLALDAAAARRQRRSPVVDLSSSRDLTLK